jgi:hypothetical protein
VATTVFYTFFVAIALVGTFVAMFPARTLEIRRRLGMPDGWWSGGWFYATRNRARITGIVVALIGCAALVIRAFG